ncbi:Hypothetical protein CINCED_3A024207 [Cinara cedri]|uniref:Uncharacterized protein n=1 Tax=Cinara cedri TaxID=506608 RepID=A0A5E4MM00_9HEMI|nr:Hypothetical protein CINCED_3A024207 [Cinara cedri]
MSRRKQATPRSLRHGNPDAEDVFDDEDLMPSLSPRGGFSVSLGASRNEETRCGKPLLQFPLLRAVTAAANLGQRGCVSTKLAAFHAGISTRGSYVFHYANGNGLWRQFSLSPCSVVVLLALSPQKRDDCVVPTSIPAAAAAGCTYA